MNNNWQEIYEFEVNLDAHVIEDLINNILNCDLKREIIYHGERFSIITSPQLSKERILSLTNAQLLRRQPEGKAEWIDFYGNKHPYNRLVLGKISLSDDYYNENETDLSQLNQKFENLNFSKAFDFIQPKTNLVSIYSDIELNNLTKEELTILGKKLRSGTITIFNERQASLIKFLEENKESLIPYIKDYYPTNLDGNINTKVYSIRKN